MITIKTLPQATAQEVFDQVVSHLRKQNKQSVSGDGDCVYRNPEGLKCAAGCLIGDDEYDPTFEGKWWGFITDNKTGVLDHRGLISKLQSVHDIYGVELWERKFKAVAKRYGLEYKRVKNGPNS